MSPFILTKERKEKHPQLKTRVVFIISFNNCVLNMDDVISIVALIAHADQLPLSLDLHVLYFCIFR